MVSNCIILYRIIQSRVLSNHIAVYCTVSYVIPSANTEGAEGRAEVFIIFLTVVVKVDYPSLLACPPLGGGVSVFISRLHLHTER